MDEKSITFMATLGDGYDEKGNHLNVLGGKTGVLINISELVCRPYRCSHHDVKRYRHSEFWCVGRH